MAMMIAIAMPLHLHEHACLGLSIKCWCCVPACPQVSMAGIGIREECVNLFMHMKTRSAVSMCREAAQHRAAW
jgi:hypothetical protein